MKKSFVAKFIITTLLGLISMSSMAQNYIEEIATLESIYERRARALLNTFIRPTDYTLIISADMEQDESKLKLYREESELSYLPGMPGVSGNVAGATKNHLHELKSTIVVHLVLSTEVSPDKEKLLQGILISKLHLDADAGDKVIVKRSKLPGNLDQKKADVLPELSWKMWALILLVTLLSVAGLIFWSNRKVHQRADESRSSGPVNLGSDQSPSEVKSSTEADEASSGHQVRAQVANYKAQVISLATEFPQISVRSITELFNSGSERELMLLFDTLGWGVSRKLFIQLSSRIWGRLGSMVREVADQSSIEERGEAVSIAARYILAAVLADGKYGDEKNPFQFLFEISKGQRAQLLSGETAINLAIIGFQSSNEQFAEILQDIDSEKQKDVILEIARVKNLPEEAIYTSAKELSEKIKTMHGQGVVKAQGAQVAAKVLRSLDPENEAKIFQDMLQNNPDEADNIRRSSVQFIDIGVYPEDIVKKAFEPIALDELVIALSSMEEAELQNVLALLPPKKAKVVGSDIRYLGNSHSIKAQANVQRKICAAIESEIRAQNLTLEEVWSSVDNQIAEVA